MTRGVIDIKGFMAIQTGSGVESTNDEIFMYPNLPIHRQDGPKDYLGRWRLSLLPYNRPLLPYNRTLLPYNRSLLPYNRSLLPYNRSLLHYNRTTLEGGVLIRRVPY